MDANAVFQTLIQAPFIAAFIWFSLKIQNQFRMDSKERERHWMEFLAQERNERQGATVALTTSLDAVSEALLSLTREIVDHNAGADERYQQITDSLNALHRRLDSAQVCKNWDPKQSPVNSDQ